MQRLNKTHCGYELSMTGFERRDAPTFSFYEGRWTAKRLPGDSLPVESKNKNPPAELSVPLTLAVEQYDEWPYDHPLILKMIGNGYDALVCLIEETLEVGYWANPPSLEELRATQDASKAGGE